MITELFDTAAGAVWKHFQEMCNIPRPSGHEERIRAHLLEIARGHGWQSRQDSTGNIVLACPGIGTLGDAPVLVLQAHMDMVCEKNADTVHDFMTDPIRPLIDGDWVTADGTTLGADNGIGVALALAVAESAMDRVPLELLITVDEERGLSGAFGCDPEIIQGRRIINLDSEEDGVFIIGCAGGTDWTVSFEKSANGGSSGDCWHCCLGGFRGGHSGVDIDKGRINAIRTAAAIVEALATAQSGMRVTGFAGGNAMNAIARECSFTVAGCARADVEAAAAQVLAGIRHAEPGATISAEPAADVGEYEIPMAVVSFITAVPDGVLAMDPIYTEQVQTSSNLGVITDAADSIAIKLMGRSTIYAEQQQIGHEIEQAAAVLGGAITVGSDFPGWAPKPDTSLLQLGLAAYREKFDAEPRIESIHAGLECGIIGAALGTDELLSFGPSIENAHSPDERVNIAGVERIFRLLNALVTRRQ